jgi:hypothetical protein
MRGARITAIEVCDDGIAVTAQGKRGGNTYAVFAIDNPDIRRRTVRVLRPGLDVHVACSLPI